MKFNSQELCVKLAGPKREGEPDYMCIDCTCPSVKGSIKEQPEKPSQDRDCKENTRGPGKGKGKKKSGSYAAGLEILREQLRESLGSAAR